MHFALSHTLIRYFTHLRSVCRAYVLSVSVSLSLAYSQFSLLAVVFGVEFNF